MTTTGSATRDIELDRMQYRADSLADATIAGILGSWAEPVAAPELATPVMAWQTQWERLATVSRVFEQWPDNRSLVDWSVQRTDVAPEIGVPLAAYVQAGRSLPDWANPGKIERAEALFMDYGALSVTMLFCSSLPAWCRRFPDCRHRTICIRPCSRTAGRPAKKACPAIRRNWPTRC